MSRTHKDAPGARKSRQARRFKERPFDYEPSAVPVTVLQTQPAELWASFADPGLDEHSRLAAATRLFGAPCPHLDQDGQPVSCTESETLTRADLTLAND